MIRALAAIVCIAGLTVAYLTTRPTEEPRELMEPWTLDVLEHMSLGAAGEFAGYPEDWSELPIPTPTPSPVPAPQRETVPAPALPPHASGSAGTVPTSVGEVQELIRRELGERFISIAACETGGWNPQVIWGPKTGRAAERGVLQVHPVHRNGHVRAAGYTWDQMFDPVANVAVAKRIYAAQGLNAWRNCL